MTTPKSTGKKTKGAGTTFLDVHRQGRWRLRTLYRTLTGCGLAMVKDLQAGEMTADAAEDDHLISMMKRCRLENDNPGAERRNPSVILRRRWPVRPGDSGQTKTGSVVRLR